MSCLASGAERSINGIPEKNAAEEEEESAAMDVELLIKESKDNCWIAGKFWEKKKNNNNNKNKNERTKSFPFSPFSFKETEEEQKECGEREGEVKGIYRREREG